VLYKTSDWHLDHGKIIEYCNRPFPDTAAMNTALIDNCNDVVGPGDELWFVGDLAMGKRYESVPLFKKLRCRNLYCVPGNHDHCHPMHPKRDQFRQLYEDAGFKILDTEIAVEIGGHQVLVCHFPYEGDSHDEDRYLEHRPVDTGLWLIHGHVHDQYRVRGRQINVGVDVWDYYPVSEDQLLEIINKI
jgi:calcineurin-like phosphoesterase family protein